MQLRTYAGNVQQLLALSAVEPEPATTTAAVEQDPTTAIEEPANSRIMYVPGLGNVC